MTCKQCNSEIGNNRFCPQCGTDNYVAPQPQYEVPVQEPVYTAQVKTPAYNEPVVPVYEQPVTPVYEQPVAPTYEQPATPAYPQQDNPYSAYAPNNAQSYGAPAQNGYSAAPEDYSRYAPQNSGYGQQQYGAPNNYATPTNGYGTPVAEDPGKGKATGAMICGILSFIFGLIPAIIALVLASGYNKVGNGANAGTAKAGKIMGIIGLVLSGISVLLVILFFGLIFAAAGAEAMGVATLLPFFL